MIRVVCGFGALAVYLQAYLRNLNRQITSSQGLGCPDGPGGRPGRFGAHVRRFGDRVANVGPRAVLGMFELLQVKAPR